MLPFEYVTTVIIPSTIYKYLLLSNNFLLNLFSYKDSKSFLISDIISLFLINSSLALIEQYFKINLLSNPFTKYFKQFNTKSFSLDIISFGHLSIISVAVLVICMNSLGISNIVYNNIITLLIDLSFISISFIIQENIYSKFSILLQFAISF